MSPGDLENKVAMPKMLIDWYRYCPKGSNIQVWEAKALRFSWNLVKSSNLKVNDW